MKRMKMMAMMIILNYFPGSTTLGPQTLGQGGTDIYSGKKLIIVVIMIMIIIKLSEYLSKEYHGHYHDVMIIMTMLMIMSCMISEITYSTMSNAVHTQ